MNNDNQHLETAESTIRHLANPKALYLTLIHRWRWVVVATIIGIIVGCCVIKFSEKQFESHGRLLAYQKLPTFMDDSTRLPDPKAYDSLFATHLQLIGSPLIIDRATKEYELDKLEEIISRLKDDQRPNDYIVKHLKVSRAGAGDSAGAFVIRVAFNHPSARECPIVVRAILDTYKKYLDHSSLAGKDKAVELIADLRTSLEQDISKKGQHFRNHIQQSPGIWDPDTLRNTHQKRVDLLEEQLVQLEIKTTALKSRIKIMEDTKSGEQTDLERLALVDDEHVARLEMLTNVKVEGVAEFFQMMYPERQEFASAQYDDLLDLFVEKTTLQGNLGPDHPRIQDLESDIKSLEAKLNEKQAKFLGPNVKSQLQPNDLVQAYERFLKLELGDVNIRIRDIKKEIDEQSASAKEVMDYSFEAQRLKEEYDRTVELHTVLVDKMQKQDLLSQFGSYTTEIIQWPKKGEQTWPNKPVVLALLTMLGFFSGVLIAIVLDLLDAVPSLKFDWRNQMRIPDSNRLFGWKRSSGVSR